MGHINFVKNVLLPVAELRKKIVKKDKNKQTNTNAWNRSRSYDLPTTDSLALPLRLSRRME